MTSVVEHFPVLVVVVSLLSAITLFIGGWINRKTACYISIATLLGQFIASLFILHHVMTIGPIYYRLGGWVPPWGIEYVMDALNAYVLVILLFLGLVCVIYSKENIAHELPQKVVAFYTIYQLLITE